MKQDRAFDIVLYGATGFTGRLVAERLDQLSLGAESFSWAIAGRKREALEKMIAGLQSRPGLFVTPGEKSFTELCSNTRVMLSTAGPYQDAGSPLVDACAQVGTDYLDLCGEPNWMLDMIRTHTASAKASGARLVFSCGFDSVPFDLGVLYAHSEAVRRKGQAGSRIRTRIRSLKGSLSGGTLASGRRTAEAARADPAVARGLLDPFLLVPDPPRTVQPDGNSVGFEEDIESWVAPFSMAPINTKTIHRTNMLLNYKLGRDLLYDEMLLAAGPAGVPGGGFETPSVARRPGEGPDRAERERGSYELMVIVGDVGEEAFRATVRGAGDPGYGSTSKIVAECALHLALRTPRETLSGGFWTPASAFGLRILPALERAGLIFAPSAH